MARQVVTTVVDDLDGTTPGAREVSFSLDGRDYTIDLSPANEKKLREALAQFVNAAQPVNRGRGNGPVLTTRQTRLAVEERRRVRAWWTSNWKNAGLKEPTDRGRIPDAVLQAYQNRHTTQAAPAAQFASPN